MKKLIKSSLIILLFSFLGGALHGQTGPTPFIIGGNEIEIEDRPFQISIQRNGRHDCGGSIINKSWVITAAHCVKGFDINDLRIAVGITEQNQVGFSGQLLEIENVFIHPDYIARTFDNDIALIELSTEIEYNDSVQPIRLINDENQNLNDVGQNAFASGWGWTISGVGLGVDHLMGVGVPIISNIDAKGQLDISQPGSAELTDNMIATGSLGAQRLGPCHGDSGGPLTVKNDEGVIHLVGLASWGVAGCIGGSNSPTMYTNVLNYEDWIYGLTCIDDVIINDKIHSDVLVESSERLELSSSIEENLIVGLSAGEKIVLSKGFSYKSASDGTLRATIGGNCDGAVFSNASTNTGNKSLLSSNIEENIFKLYPNPALDYVNIEFTHAYEPDSLFEVFDINGSVVLSKNKLESGAVVDISSLEKGAYIFTFKTGDLIKNGKIIKR
ncbi:S1 family serine peptidase [Aquimarina agarivorans]|uniref:S1 family serine peptidase n=1 Tax=Aquimarina agarivorans TaxID=980584 RepID=UPI000248EBE9|nr:serine protease [Aquimarina agarivorans]